MTEVNVGYADEGFVQVDIPGDKNLEGKIVIKGTYDLLSKLKNSEEHEGH
jgi:cobalt-zinc-cadmium efflux system membrane fusion protein